VASLDSAIEETVALGGRDLRIARPRDSEELIDERRFEHDEFMPYWAELWPSGIALARVVAQRALRGARTLDLGCGLGLVSVAAALAGARVTASDWAAEALEFAAANAVRNGARIDTLLCDWADPTPLVEGAPWQLVLASDVLYEERNGPPLLELLPRLAGDRGEIWIADPGRAAAGAFFARASERWRLDTRELREGGVTVTITRMRPRACG